MPYLDATSRVEKRIVIGRSGMRWTPEERARRVQLKRVDVHFNDLPGPGRLPSDHLLRPFQRVPNRHVLRGSVFMFTTECCVSQVGSEPCCAGQVKIDTKLSYPSTFFIVIGAEIAEIRMFACTVIEHLDIRHDIISRLLTRIVVTMRRPFAF